ncbi:MAG: hypothetical protein ACK4JC_10610 [Silanimonas lenta]
MSMSAAAIRTPLLSIACLLGGLLTAPAFGSSVAQVEALVLKRDATALVQAQALAKAQPHSAEAHVLLARAQLQAGKASDAIESARTATQLAPGGLNAGLRWIKPGLNPASIIRT